MAPEPARPRKGRVHQPEAMTHYDLATKCVFEMVLNFVVTNDRGHLCQAVAIRFVVGVN